METLSKLPTNRVNGKKEVHEEGTFSAQRGLWKLVEGKLNEVTNDTYDDADSFPQS